MVGNVAPSRPRGRAKAATRRPRRAFAGSARARAGFLPRCGARDRRRVGTGSAALVVRALGGRLPGERRGPLRRRSRAPVATLRGHLWNPCVVSGRFRRRMARRCHRARKPLDTLGEELFSAHMVKHELLMIVAAPLLVLGRPLAAWVWALPPAWRGALGSCFRQPAWRVPWLALTAPLSAWALHALALWLWHLPARESQSKWSGRRERHASASSRSTPVVQTYVRPRPTRG